MGKSTRKQKLKKQDFQKKKLKVGKGPVRPSNATDTSFSTRSVSIRNQHLIHDHGDLSKRFPLLKHHNNVVRKETLQQFQNNIPDIINTSIMAPLITQCIPLINDESKQVRAASLDLFHEIGSHNSQVLQLHCRVFILYICMSMTHIVTAIQLDSTKFLKMMLKYCGEEICRLAWNKLIDGIFNILGWSKNGKNHAAGIAQSAKRDAQSTCSHLDALCALIETGCLNKRAAEGEGNDNEASETINQYLIPQFPQPYEHLKLFARELTQNSSQEGDNSNGTTNVSIATDRTTRVAIVKQQYLSEIRKQCKLLVSSGGPPGKSANSLIQLLDTVYGVDDQL
ncbi:hypothetical protein TBLA_0A03290 [Henningerozyma blattae CBS 6284]|uniref:Pre-rRNA-processing protein n=1 Tax=Henningerozyma blattae (strain ATCC 34711 / CBS 6284 / DSM 70876 / NBRC 10599 / NRRL Y-10934 / UCD 77-7) TaxID=1071380 RepID=I2GVH7_HENB6|nr:hypothetical protein TBLA_0A03290 [Tetrapisispora blattae CBS 6284]CCH58129.1 hypothetical protein TBLA_0A03290 [Tetrapisispora blattae CBS 6284]